MDDATRYHLLRLLEQNPELTQREAAAELGISLGKLNYCLRALVEKGMVKAQNFRNSRQKAGYMYILTPQGIEEKMRVTRAFLARKHHEYDELVTEIEQLQAEVDRQLNAER